MKLTHNHSGIWIGGETASGKSSVALALADQLGGEIVAVDSMQVFRGLDIGTAKPAPEERAVVRHHLLDVVGLDEVFSVSDFCRRVEVCLEDMRKRGVFPVLCGGTGLYFKALLDGVGSAPESDQALRRVLESTPLPELIEELRERDPETHDRIDLCNPRRVYRAVEVLRLSGRGMLNHRAPWQERRDEVPLFFALRRDPEDLRERIERRVDQMFREGLVGETAKLLGKGLEQNRIAMQAIGYRQVVEHLRGVRDLESTVELVKRRTWQFARRQRNWFDRQLPVERLDVGRDESAGQTARRILERAGELGRTVDEGRFAAGGL